MSAINPETQSVHTMPILGKEVSLKGTIRNIRPLGVTSKGTNYRGFTLVVTQVNELSGGRVEIANKRFNVTAWGPTADLLTQLQDDLVEGRCVEVKGWAKPSTGVDASGRPFPDDVSLDAITFA